MQSLSSPLLRCGTPDLQFQRPSCLARWLPRRRPLPPLCPVTIGGGAAALVTAAAATEAAEVETVHVPPPPGRGKATL